jgi:alpha-galactosidase
MKALGDYLHSKGFKFGMYGCAGKTTCGGYPGRPRARVPGRAVYASWGVDYFKYDWCDHGTANGPETYRIMSDAIRRPAGRSSSACASGARTGPGSGPSRSATSGARRATSGRPTRDPAKNKWEHGWKDLLDMNVGLEKYAGPGPLERPGHARGGQQGPDASPSREGAFQPLVHARRAPDRRQRRAPHDARDPRDPDQQGRDRDRPGPAGHQGFRYRVDKDKEIWAKELSNKEWAVCVLNTGDAPAKLTLDMHELTFLTEQYYDVTDVWTGKPAGTAMDLHTATVDSHDVMLFRLKPGS